MTERFCLILFQTFKQFLPVTRLAAFFNTLFTRKHLKKKKKKKRKNLLRYSTTSHYMKVFDAFCSNTALKGSLTQDKKHRCLYKFCQKPHVLPQCLKGTTSIITPLTREHPLEALRATKRHYESRVSCPRTQRPGLVPRPLDPESNALTIRPLRFSVFCVYFQF